MRNSSAISRAVALAPSQCLSCGWEAHWGVLACRSSANGGRHPAQGVCSPALSLQVTSRAGCGQPRRRGKPQALAICDVAACVCDVCSGKSLSAPRRWADHSPPWPDALADHPIGLPVSRRRLVWCSMVANMVFGHALHACCYRFELAWMLGGSIVLAACVVEGSYTLFSVVFGGFQATCHVLCFVRRACGGHAP